MVSSRVSSVLSRVLVVFMATLALIAVSPPDRVYAGYCSGSYRGVASCQGYFTKAFSPATPGTVDNIFDMGVYTNNVTDFSAHVWNQLYWGTYKHQVGAAFLIHNMLGYSAGSFSSKADGIAKAKDYFTEWEDRVKYIDSQGGITWDKALDTASAPGMGVSAGEYRNSAWFTDIQDDAFHMKPNETIFVIEFAFNGGYSRIERKCGNLVGDMTPLPAVPPPPPQVFEIDSNVQGWGDGQTAVVDAQGSAPFGHFARVTGYAGVNRVVRYRIERAVSTVDGACPGNGPWTSIHENQVTLNRDGNFTIWGYGDALASQNRNTVKLICQRVVITDNGGATFNSAASTLQAAARITSGSVSMNAAGGGYAEPGETVTMSGTVSGQQNGAAPFTVGYNISFPQTVPGMTSVPGAGVFTDSFNVGGSVTRTRSYSITIPISAQAGQQVCLRVTVTNPTLDRYFNNSSNRIAEACVRVVHKPTVAVQGGDVAAGVRFESGGVCTGSDTSTVAGWPNVPAFNAAGSSHAVFATNRIYGFATAKATVAPTRLAFANTPPSAAPQYGGSFGSIPCVTDHWAAKSVDSSTGSISAALNNAGSGSFEFSGNVSSMANVTVGQGVRKVVYVDGDLYIGDNIRYSGRGSWGSIADIPGVKIIVRGDIFISSGVTELNGIYVAQPDSGGSGGQIYTCANGMGSPVSTSSASYFADCNVPLVVNGTFTARKIHFGRTRGTAARGVSDIAEKFNYLPELWLARWPSDGTAQGGGYDAITALPPVF